MSFEQGADQGSAPPGMPAEPVPVAPTSALFGSIEPRNLGLGTAIEVAFKALAKPAFVGPLLVISVMINAVLEVAFAPLMRSLTTTPGAQPTIEDLNAILGAAGVAFVVSIIGSTIAAIYGTVWAAAASVGPFPTIGEALSLVRRRSAGVLGAAILVSLIQLGLIALGAVVLIVLGQINRAITFGVGVGLVIVFVWLAVRLYMTPWLAADGAGVTASVRGSWRMTEGGALRILGWTIAFSLLFGLLAAAIWLVLGRVPFIGSGIGQGLTLALTYGAGVTLYRRTQASATPAATVPGAPSGTDSTIG